MTDVSSRSGLTTRLFKMASKIEAHEIKAVLFSFAYLFCVMSGYYILRPVRDAFAVEMPEGEVENLFVVVFVVMLLVIPVYGFINSRVKLSTLLPWVYVFFALNLVGFYFMLQNNPVISRILEELGYQLKWTPRIYFVWVSVFNLFVVSVFWSFMADLFSKEQSKRLFGFIAGGASTGAIAGPFLVTLLVTPEYWGLPIESVSTPNLLLISAVFLLVPVLIIRSLIRHRNDFRDADKSPDDMKQAIGGNPFAGVVLFFRSPYLMGIGTFIVLYTAMSTFVWLQLVDLIKAENLSREETTSMWALMDLAVNVLAVFTQLFGTARLASRFGLVVTLAVIPLFMIAGFAVVAIVPLLPILIVLQILRRAGNYAITRPGREMLFTIVDKESKYKAKNAIDTAVYRGGDAATAQLYSALERVLNFSGIAIVGAFLAALWFVVAILLGRNYESKSVEDSEAAREKAAEFA